MAKKVRFPLVMSDDFEVRDLDELKEHFDIESVIGYFKDGRLLNWLDARYYDEEATKVSALDKDDPQITKKLCEIFGIEYEDEEEIDVEEIEKRRKRLNLLKQYTADKEILERVDLVAFNQEDLGKLLYEEKPLIYLCHNKFIIPLRETHKTYIGIGKAVAVIRSDKVVDFEKLNIKFENITFDDEYLNLIKKQSVEQPKKSNDQPNNNQQKNFEDTEDTWGMPRRKKAFSSSTHTLNIIRNGDTCEYSTTIKHNNYVSEGAMMNAFIKIAKKFQSKILISDVFNAKSISDMMLIKFSEGTHIRIKATGYDSFEAVEQLAKILES